MNTSNPFPVLTFVSRLLRGLGWLITVAGALYGVITGIIEPMLPKHVFAAGDAFDFFCGAAVAVVGIGVVAYGELIGVAFAIEANTRRAADAIASQQVKQP
jgi:CBS domain containing-hemolysin-like protein